MRFSQKKWKKILFCYFLLRRSLSVTNFRRNSKNLVFHHFLQFLQKSDFGTKFRFSQNGQKWSNIHLQVNILTFKTIKNSKNVFFHILTAVKTRNLPGKWIFFDLVFAGRPERQQYTFWTWDDTTHGHRFSKKCQKPHFLGLLAIFLKFRSFRKKSGRVSFHHLWSPNLMQKIRNILQLDFQILNHLK